MITFFYSCSEDSGPTGNGIDQPQAVSSFEPQFGDGIPYDGENLIRTHSWPSNWTVGHDGKPYISDRVKVYSNYASQSIRKTIAEHAESSIDSIFAILDMDKSKFNEFEFNPSFTAKRIHIHADHDEDPNNWGLAYRDGILIKSLESPFYVNNPIFPKERWLLILQHELFHVFEFLIIGDMRYQQANDVWMREGGANFGSKHNKVQTLKQLQDWQAAMAGYEGQGNPIAIHVFRTDFPSEIYNARRTGEYYPFFELAVRYLFDPVGRGRTIEDLKQHYINMGNGMDFNTSFTQIFSMTVGEYEAAYFALMTDYLQNPDRIRGSSRYGKTDFNFH